MLEIVSGAIYLFLFLNNAAVLRWESFESRNRRAPLITTVVSSLSISLSLSLFLPLSPPLSLCLSLSLSLGSLLFSTPSLSSTIFSFYSSSYHAHPFHDYTPFSMTTFHFDFLEFHARCQMFSYWIVRTFFPLAPFFFRGSSFAQFLSSRKFASTAR